MTLNEDMNMNEQLSGKSNETMSARLGVNGHANIKIARGYDLKYAKLQLSVEFEDTGAADVSDVAESDLMAGLSPPKRAIIFVIDRSGSMSGSRIDNVKEALKPFLTEICEDPNTIIRMVLFNSGAQAVHVPTVAERINPWIEAELSAGGGTNFVDASSKLVEEARKILAEFPEHQLTVIMCSDGEVAKDNAQNAQSHWKSFVNSEYRMKHEMVPFVECIGISSSHDADILDGFICEDDAGNYSMTQSNLEVLQAFNNAQSETMSRIAKKVVIEFPIPIYTDVYTTTTNAVANKSTMDMGSTADGDELKVQSSESQLQLQMEMEMETKITTHELIVTEEMCVRDFWVSIAELDAKTQALQQNNNSTTVDLKEDDDNRNESEANANANANACLGLSLLINNQAILIEVCEVMDKQEIQNEAIAYYHQVIKDMLSHLRMVTNETTLKKIAVRMESEIVSKKELWTHLTAEPLEQQKLKAEIHELLMAAEQESTADGDEKSNDATADAADAVVAVHAQRRLKRAELMKRYKKMHKIWKEHRRIITKFNETLKAVKELIHEITLGKVRMQEIRQHIVNLHFRKKHAKRMSRLMLSATQLRQRQEWYDRAVKPTAEQVSEISDEFGSGCYLSTQSFRECAMDADPLWMCGRVNRSGGAAVSNPEHINIQYISPDLVSDSYFRLALEASPKGFCDSSREIVNCRLFPIYGNQMHYDASRQYLNEAMAHTLSGRIDVRVVTFDALFVVLGYMLSANALTSRNIQRIFEHMLPSLQMICRKKVPPFRNDFQREIDSKGTRVTLRAQHRFRLERFLHSFKSRTTAWISNHRGLFADALLNLDMAEEVTCAAAASSEFWLSILFQRVREIFKSQVPKRLDEDILRRKVVKQHQKILQVLIRGAEEEYGVDEKSDDANTADSGPDSNHVVVVAEQHGGEDDAEEEDDANTNTNADSTSNENTNASASARATTKSSSKSNLSNNSNNMSGDTELKSDVNESNNNNNRNKDRFWHKIPADNYRTAFYKTVPIPKTIRILGNKKQSKLLKSLSELNPEQLREWDPLQIKPSSKQMCLHIISRVDVRDLMQAKHFFAVLSDIGCDLSSAAADNDWNARNFGQQFKYDSDSNSKSNATAIGKFLHMLSRLHDNNDENNNDNGNESSSATTMMAAAENMSTHTINILRAICAVSIVCYTNKLYHSHLEWFGDDVKKQLFCDPTAVLRKIHDEFVLRNIKHEYSVFLEQQRIEELRAMHSDPPLPDLVDEFGNLPYLRCGWSKCGRVFDNRDVLLGHVMRVVKPKVFHHRFHLHCRQVLENNLDITFEEFKQGVCALFGPKQSATLLDRNLRQYYTQFKPIFKKLAAQ